MPSLYEDLGRLGRRVIEAVEDRSGRQVVPQERLEVLESAESELRVAQKTLEFIGFSLLNYQPGTPDMPGGFELRPQIRRIIAQQSLRAWIEDPMAGQQVDLYVSFVLGRGVPRPQAHDPEVQQHLDRTWDDKSNQRVLTSFKALIEKAIDLCIQSNVYFTFFDDGEDGMVRVSTKRFADVEDVVRHPVDENRILFYKAIERRLDFDYRTGTYRTDRTATTPEGAPKTVYLEAWDAFDDDNPAMVAQDDLAGGRAALEPPAAMLRPGKVVHLAVNKTSDMAFGVPRMQRLINWFGAYNDMLVSFRDRMKAMASVYMTATAQGTQRDLDRLAMMATRRTSAFGGSQELDPDTRPGVPGGPGIIGQNQSLKYEPFKIDSGAQDVSAAAPVIRGQINGPWPDHYTAGNAAALAGATAMELPVLKFVEREQELIADVFRTLGDATIDAAVRVGDITEYRDPSESELVQIDAAAAAGEPPPFEMQGSKIKRDLGFEISLPSPLKRTMGDLVSAAVETATAVDPTGANHELSRWLLGFILREAFDEEDPSRIVDQVLPRHPPAPPAVLGPDGQPLPVAPPPPGPPGALGADGQHHPESTPYGAPRQSPPAEQQRVQQTPAGDFESVTDVADAYLSLLEVPVTNGNGAGH